MRQLPLQLFVMSLEDNTINHLLFRLDTMQRQRFNIAIAFLFLVFLFTSCLKDKPITDVSAKLSFSTDSILYDTVFTTVGSTTKRFKVYNRHDKPIVISDVRLGGGTTSFFRFNIDGTPAVSTGNIEIPANDSIFCFVEVTVDPNNQNSPLVIRDSVLFTTNGNLQKVILEAWGQDAYFHVEEVLSCNQIWTNDKPHVIYRYAIIPSGCSLTINPNVRVHIHKNAVLAADSAATLIVNGTQNNEVIFQGDRLDPEFADGAGQWGYIWLSSLSRNSQINWAIIKNGTVGILCDNFTLTPNPTVTIKNTIIKNMSAAAVWGRGTKIDAYNCVFANCGQYVAALTLGGRYNFYHCTFANYSTSSGARQFSTLVLNNYYEDINSVIQLRNLDSANFYNCIIYGDVDDELLLDSFNNQSVNFNYKFYHCVIKTTLNTSGSNYISCTINQDPMFVSPAGNNFEISSTSSAINKGNLQVVNWYNFLLNTDLKNEPRNVDAAPDAGAYEY
jgi:hypothetical protein